MVHGVWSDDPAAQLEATTQFRKLLSIGKKAICNFCNGVCGEYPLCLNFCFVFYVERSPPIDEVIKAGVVPRFVEFLARQDQPQLQVGSVVAYVLFFLLYSCSCQINFEGYN